MTVLEKLERKIKRLKQEPLGFRPEMDDLVALLELADLRIRELEDRALAQYRDMPNLTGVNWNE